MLTPLAAEDDYAVILTLNAFPSTSVTWTRLITGWKLKRGPPGGSFVMLHSRFGCRPPA